jgi:hypothetical protein
VLKEALEKANQVTACSCASSRLSLRSHCQQELIQTRAEADKMKQGQVHCRICRHNTRHLPPTQSQAKLEQEVERHRKAMGLKDGAQQLMEQQQQAAAEAARAKASLAAATERMSALVPAAAHDKDRDVFEGVEAELQGLRRQVEALQQKMKRTSMEEKITARQQELDQQLQTSAAATSPTPSKATIPAPLSPSEAAAMAAAAQVFNRFFVAVCCVVWLIFTVDSTRTATTKIIHIRRSQRPAHFLPPLPRPMLTRCHNPALSSLRCIITLVPLSDLRCYVQVFSRPMARVFRFQIRRIPLQPTARAHCSSAGDGSASRDVCHACDVGVQATSAKGSRRYIPPTATSLVSLLPASSNAFRHPPPSYHLLQVASAIANFETTRDLSQVCAAWGLKVILRVTCDCCCRCLRS